MGKDPPEYKFARDIVRFVTYDYYIGVHFKPRGAFLQTDDDSPFTSTVKLAVKNTLNDNGHNYLELYDHDFRRYPHRDIFNHRRVASRVTYNFMEKIRSNLAITQFLYYSIVMAVYAAMSCLHGVRRAPYFGMSMLADTIKVMKKSRVFTDKHWERLQSYCEAITTH